MPSSSSSSPSSHSAVQSSLLETTQRVRATLLPAIDAHVNSTSYDAGTDSLDFLDAKNGLLLSYLIELAQLVRLKAKLGLAGSSSKSSSKEGEKGDGDEEEGELSAAAAETGRKKEEETELASCLGRLNEMRVAIDKIRPLERKMRYQIDRLLTDAGAVDSSSFASGAVAEDNDEGGGAGEAGRPADPLSFRPNPEGMATDDNEDDAASASGGDAGDGCDSDSAEDDEDLRAARAAVRSSSSGSKPSSSSKRRSRSRTKGGGNDDDDDELDAEPKASGIYQPPRHQAVPFAAQEQAQEKAERQLRRQRARLRQSELLATLRSTSGLGESRPEEDDLDGGAGVGKQRERARKLAERERDRMEFEEEGMIRLVTSRKDKKARARMLREEESNLGAIADLGRLARGVEEAFGGGGGGENDSDNDGGRDGIEVGGRHPNGRRRRRNVTEDGFDGEGGGEHSRKKQKKKSRGGGSGKNSYQRALYGVGDGKTKTKSKR